MAGRQEFAGLRPGFSALALTAFASAQLANSRLVFIGEGPCRPELERLAQESGVRQQVLCVGHLNEPQPYFGGLDVLLMSSVSEQMPMGLLEAMACGLPTMCTDVGDIGDILGDVSQQQLVPSGNLHAYVEALRRFAACPVLRTALGRANHTRCVTEYAFERMQQAYVEEYETALRCWRFPQR